MKPSASSVANPPWSRWELRLWRTLLPALSDNARLRAEVEAARALIAAREALDMDMTRANLAAHHDAMVKYHTLPTPKPTPGGEVSSKGASMSSSDGGPAFPCEYNMSTESGASRPVDGHGLTIRDYFAAKVIPEVWRYASVFTAPVSAALLSQCGNDPVKIAEVMKSEFAKSFNDHMDNAISEEAYRVADFMLRTREGGRS